MFMGIAVAKKTLLAYNNMHRWSPIYSVLLFGFSHKPLLFIATVITDLRTIGDAQVWLMTALSLCVQVHRHLFGWAIVFPACQSHLECSCPVLGLSSAPSPTAPWMLGVCMSVPRKIPLYSVILICLDKKWLPSTLGNGVLQLYAKP